MTGYNFGKVIMYIYLFNHISHNHKFIIVKLYAKKKITAYSKMNSSLGVYNAYEYISQGDNSLQQS